MYFQKNNKSYLTGLLAICLIGSGISCKSQSSEKSIQKNTAIVANVGGEVSIKGKVKSQLSGKVYFESLNDRGIATRLDSTALDKNNAFSFKRNITEPSVFQLLIGSQRVVLLLDGGENLSIEADGLASPDNMGNATIKGSKAMDYFQEINKMGFDMQQKAQGLQAAYQEATTKKDNAKMEQIRKTFEAEQSTVVSKIKTILPEMGTSIVALFATNYLNPEKDFDAIAALADRLQAAGVKYTAAQMFINNVNRKRGTQLGQAAPDFSLTDLKGQQIKLSDLRGKVVILDFWATWCGPCVASFPAMQKVADKYKDNPNVKILFVNTFERTAKDQWKNTVANFITQKNMTNYDVLLDMGGANGGETALSYGVEGIPAKFCIDKTGKLRFKSSGFPGNESLIAEVSKWIEDASK